MSRILAFVSIGVLFSVITTVFAQDRQDVQPVPNEPKHLTFRAVPFTDVQIARSIAIKDDAAIWGKRLETNRNISIPHNFDWCEKTGRFANFAKAAGLQEGDFEGIYFNDSDVYKLLEGTAYSLRVHPDPELEKRADAVIDWIAAAQEPSGYINTYYQLREPDKKWTNTRVMHELYCGGHMVEAAVAYAQATGKTKLLDVAEKFMDHIATVFGPEEGKRVEVPGHEEIELALVKLYQYTGKKKYMEMAQFFVDVRGNASKRTDKLQGPYSQDHKPVREQTEIVGHAVRAVYLYAGVADVAAYTGDRGLIDAMDALWNDVVHKKMYITGGIGARHAGEAFGDAFELPNKTAYCETCAAIGLIFWAQRLNLLHGEAKYADVVELALYNGVLSGIGRDGKSFFYVNPLASDGNHHRQPFFDCACCPTNVVRFVPSISGYVYATEGDTLVVNQFIPGDATIKLPKAEVEIRMRSWYPWDGTIKFTGTVKRLDPEYKAPIPLKLRIPGWCDLAPVEVKNANGDPIAYKVENGYAAITIREEPEFAFTYNMPQTYRRIVANPRVEADRGRVAFQSGPIVYCFEEADNPGLNDRTMIKRNLQWHEDIRGTVGPHADDYYMRISIKDRTGKDLTAIPYYSWDSRKNSGKMMVWVRQEGLPRDLDPDRPMWTGADGKPLLYSLLPDDWFQYMSSSLEPLIKQAEQRKWEPLLSDKDIPLPFAETLEPTASHCHANDSVEALLQDAAPNDSNDHSIPRFTFWNHKGSAEWVAVEREEPFSVSKCSVYWFDDAKRGGGCRVPRSATLSYKTDGVWQKLDVPVSVAKDTDNAVTFPAVTTTGLRLDVQLQAGFSGGILRWKIEQDGK